MLIYKCDRCLRIIEDRKEINEYIDICERSTLHLCPKCNERLNEFLDGRKTIDEYREGSYGCNNVD